MNKYEEEIKLHKRMAEKFGPIWALISSMEKMRRGKTPCSVCLGSGRILEYSCPCCKGTGDEEKKCQK